MSPITETWHRVAWSEGTAAVDHATEAPGPCRLDWSRLMSSYTPPAPAEDDDSGSGHLSALPSDGRTSVDLFGVEHADRRAMGSHQSASSGADEWLTPPDLIDELGAFDLDPCAAIDAPWSTASKHYTIADDGLRQKWSGRVWLNPPYSTADRWLARMVEHNHGTALIFARTETRLWFKRVWPHASGLLFLRGRLHFHYRDGKRAAANSGAPSVLVAYGASDALVLARAEHLGQYVALGDASIEAALRGDA